MKKLAIFILALSLFLAPVSAQAAIMVGDWGGWATVGTNLTGDISGYFGYSYFNPNHWYLVKADYKLAKMGDVQTKAGLDYQWVSSGGALLEVLWGFSTMLSSNLMVGTDLSLVRFNIRTGGGGTTDVIPAAYMVLQLTL